jgi:hypothetical protein
VRRKLPRLGAVVVSVAETPDNDPAGTVERGERKRTAAEVSKAVRRCQNRGVTPSPGISSGDDLIRPERHPACWRREARPGLLRNVRTPSPSRDSRSLGGVKEQAASGSNRDGESTDAGVRGGAARSSEEAPVMGLERRAALFSRGHGPTEAIGSGRSPWTRQSRWTFEAGGVGGLQAREGQPGGGWSTWAVDCGARG